MRVSGIVPARRSSFRSSTALAPALILAILSIGGIGGCKNEPSNLEKMAKGENTPPPPEVSKTEGAPKASADATGGAGKDELAEPLNLPLDERGLPIPPLEGAAKLITPGAEDQRVELRLALDEGARYRITTIGMLELPLFDRPVGFAREEQLSLSDCTGEAADRTCLLSHKYRNYDAEPPTGSALEKDEALVAEFETSHRIDASGLRITETAIEGTPTNPAAKALTQVHRFYCIRLPSEPVGVGATWRDVCRTRLGGSIVTRELVWRLAKLENAKEGMRAELEYAGRVRRVNPDESVRNGEIKGSLLFWADAGEPHLMRERVIFVLDAERGLSTGTDFRHQFTKVGKNDELIRTDGRPFDQPPVMLNDLRRVPNGATRDAEMPKAK